MLEISDEDFDRMISRAMEELPAQYIEGLNNVAVVYEEEPTETQRKTLNLRCNQTLYGLYEGIPRTKRGAGYNMVLPDKITIFKRPILQSSTSLDHLRWQVKHTLWHEIAHYYGLEHGRIHELEKRMGGKH